MGMPLHMTIEILHLSLRWVDAHITECSDAMSESQLPPSEYSDGALKDEMSGSSYI